MHTSAFQTQHALSRSAPAIAVVGIHVVMIYVLAASMGIVRVPTLTPPAKAVFIPEQAREIPPPELPAEPVIQPTFPDLQPVQTPLLNLPPSETAPIVPQRPVTTEQPVQQPLPVEPVVEQQPQPLTLQVLHRVEPDYPPASRRAGEEGTVHLSVMVDGAGRAREVLVSQSSGAPRLDRAAQDAVRRWRFTQHKLADPIRTHVAVTFRLTG